MEIASFQLVDLHRCRKRSRDEGLHYQCSSSVAEQGDRVFYPDECERPRAVGKGTDEPIPLISCGRG
jgi:hypothetical protein